MGSDAVRFSHSTSPQPASSHHTLPRLAELGRPSTSSSLKELLNPVVDDREKERHHAAGPPQHQSPLPAPAAPSAWTAVNHPPRASVLEPRVDSYNRGAPPPQVPQSQPPPQSQRRPSPPATSLPDLHAASPNFSRENQFQDRLLKKPDERSIALPNYQFNLPDSRARAVSKEDFILPKSSPNDRRAKGTRHQQQKRTRNPPVTDYRGPHPATPPSPAPSPELEATINPSLPRFTGPQQSSFPGVEPPRPSVPVVHYIDDDRPRVRFSDHASAMPMSPPPHPATVVQRQSPMPSTEASQSNGSTPSSSDLCDSCLDVHRAALVEFWERHGQQPMPESLAPDDRILHWEKERHAIITLREEIRQKCPNCAQFPPETGHRPDLFQTPEVLIDRHPAASYEAGKRRLSTEQGTAGSDGPSKSRKVSPAAASPALCEFTPPPDPDNPNRYKFLLSEVDDILRQPRPMDETVPEEHSDRVAPLLGRATVSNLNLRNEPAPNDSYNMFFDPEYDRGKLSISARVAAKAACQPAP